MWLNLIDEANNSRLQDNEMPLDKCAQQNILIQQV